MIVTYFHFEFSDVIPYGNAACNHYKDADPFADMTPRPGECVWIVPGTLSPEDVS